MHGIRRAQQQRRRIDRTAGDNYYIGAISFSLPTPPNHDLSRLATGCTGPDALDIGIGQQSHIRVLQCGLYSDDMRVGFRLHETGKAVASAAADAVAVLRTMLIKHDPDGQRRNVEQLGAWFTEGKIKPVVSERISLAEVPAAMTRLLQRKVKGKIVVVPGS